MTLRETVFARCTTHAGMTALIGDRCYPERLPENAVFPAISFIAPVSMDTGPYRTHDNANSPVTRAVSRVQLNCYAETGDDAEALAAQAVQAWSGYRVNCTIGYSFVVNTIASREDAINAYRFIVDVMMEHAV